MNSQFRLILLILPLLLVTCSPLVGLENPVTEETSVAVEGLNDWRSFSIEENRILDAIGVDGETFIPETRATLAVSRLGIHGPEGTVMGMDLPPAALLPRSDLALLLVEGDVQIGEVRADLADIQGLAVREFISPSGLVVQGTIGALSEASSLPGIAATLSVPLAMMADDTILAAWADDTTGESLVGMEVRIEGWRDNEAGHVPDNWLLADESQTSISANVGHLSQIWLDEANRYDAGRWEGKLSLPSIEQLLAEEAVGWLRQSPVIGVDNDRSRTHMDVNSIDDYFTTDLDGSGEVVAVADTGIDHDHGDFGSRIDAKVDMVGDGSTADTDTGHGTHVACTVLGDGTQGGYTGVAPAANLYFQAMEHDPSGNLYSPSINYLLNSAYDNAARTHTNSWGSQDTTENGEYTSDSEDVDERSNYYDRYYNGREGLTILFAAGNDGPNSGSVGPPGTAKNAVVVGMHQARYTGSPDTVMTGSSRGPTDDGRIKPDILAPGGYVRSCLAQEAQDTSGSTWESQWYIEYTGTSMATPNAAGAAALIREYLTEIAQRPDPQGALVKALMVLGAEDIGSRDVPNNNEGWGRVDLRNSLAPSGNRGIWVDDRAVLSTSGSVKTYSFEVEQSNLAFKAVLTWSDERGSRFSTTQLVNDLDLEVETPDGSTYLGNVFAAGRSVTTGTRDSLNNLEVVLVDNAQVGTWTVRVKDMNHAGSRSQPYALAVSGNGVNDLRPDPMPVPGSINSNIAIPQVGDDLIISAQVQNQGNVVVNDLLIHFSVEGGLVDTATIDLGPGGTQYLYWNWQPQQAGDLEITVEVDPQGDIDEIRENNNVASAVIGVTTPGVKLESAESEVVLDDPEQTTTSWEVTLTNTALLPTNASVVTADVTRPTDGLSLSSWYVGFSSNNFSLNGSDSVNITVNMVHPAPPEPGTYIIPLTGIDVDNGISYPFELRFVVPPLAKVRFSIPTMSYISPVADSEISIDIINEGNDDIGYDLFIQSPSGWRAGFVDLGSLPGAPSGSTGAISKDGTRAVGITTIPPQMMVTAGTQLSLTLMVVSQTEEPITWTESIPLQVAVHEELYISLESSLGLLRPDSQVNMLYTIINNGNTEMTLHPSTDLPGGWEMISSTNAIVVDSGDAVNFFLTIEGNGLAIGGEVALHMTSSSGRVTWYGNISVHALPNPDVTFLSIEYPNGSLYDHTYAGGAHPTGGEIELTWLITNDGDGAWLPTASLSMPSNYFGDCDNVPTVVKGDAVPVSCRLIIPNSESPGFEPQIQLVLSDGMVERVADVSLVVAQNLAVTWSVESAPQLVTGAEQLLRLRLENTGNAQVSNVIQVDSPQNWDVSIDGQPSITLAAGESVSVQIFVTANEPGEGTMVVRLAGGGDIAGSEMNVSLTSTGEVIGESPRGAIATIIWSTLGIVILSALVVAFIVIRQGGGDDEIKRAKYAQYPVANLVTPSDSTSASGPTISQSPPALSTPTSAPPEEVFESVAESSSQNGESEQSEEDDAHRCWFCLKGLPETGWSGCPSCGARYHSESADCEAGGLENCRNCEAPAKEFLQR